MQSIQNIFLEWWLHNYKVREYLESIQRKVTQFFNETKIYEKIYDFYSSFKQMKMKFNFKLFLFYFSFEID
jgi:hypothetical protein